MLKGISLVADIIKLAYVLAALLASVASADDYRPARPRKPEPAKVEPIIPVDTEPPSAAPVERPNPDPAPGTAVDTAPSAAQLPEEPPAAAVPPALPEPQAHAPSGVSGPAQVSRDAVPVETDLRPVLPFYTASWCAPCQPIKAKIKGNGFPEFRFEERPPTAGMSIPQFGIIGSDGVEYAFMPTSFPAGRQREELIGAWRRRNQGKPLPGIVKSKFPVAEVQPPMSAAATFAQAPHLSMTDQLRKYLGDEATIVVTPAMPINTAMDDGTVVKFRSITLNYKMVSGQPVFLIADPKPQAWQKHVGIWWEADLIGGRANLDDVPPTVILKTSRGDVKIKIGLEPQ